MLGTYHFLRYVTPGLVFLVELTLVVAVGSAGWGWLGWIVERVRVFDTVEGALTLLFSSGGIGYLMSTIHHTFQNRYLGPDYRATAAYILDNGLLRREEIVPGDNPGCLPKSKAWLVVTTFWHSCTGASRMLKEATRTAENLADLMHAAGSAVVAAVAAGTVTLVLRVGRIGFTNLVDREIVALLLAVAFLSVHSVSYRYLVGLHERFVKGVLSKYFHGPGDDKAVMPASPHSNP